MCIIIDGMDQSKLLIPYLLNIPKSTAHLRHLQTHLIGVLNHGRSPKGYFDVLQYPHDKNLTMNVILSELEATANIPDTIYIQMDNCFKENKNQFVFGLLAVLVKLDIAKEVVLKLSKTISSTIYDQKPAYSCW